MPMRGRRRVQLQLTCSKRLRCAVSSGGADRTAYRLVAGRCAAAAAAAVVLLRRNALGRRKLAPG